MDGCWCCGDELQSPTSLDPSWSFVFGCLAEPLVSEPGVAFVQAPPGPPGDLRAQTSFRVVSAHTLRALGSDFELVEIHAHERGEHSVRGKLFDAEVHFVWRSSVNLLLVVSVMLEYDHEDGHGEAGLLSELLGGAVQLPELSGPLYLLPGSLTSAGGSPAGSVQWVVLERPQQLGREEYARFANRGLFQPVRVLQPVKGRMVVYVASDAQ